MKVGTKLATGFLLVVLLILLTLLFCSGVSRRTHEKLKALKNVAVPRAILMNKVDSAVGDADHAIMEYLIQGKTQEKENAQYALAHLKRAGPQYLANQTYMSTDEHETAEELIAKIKTFVSVGSDIINAKDQGVSNGELLKTKTEKLHPVRRTLLEQLRKYRATQMGKLAKAEEAVGKAYTLDIRLTLLATVLGVILTVVITFFTTRSIVKPLKVLNKGANIISTGDELDYKIETEAKDEIGQLSRAFGRGAKKLMKANTLVDELNKEISERKRTEEKLEKAMKTKSQFVSMVTHELRVPLTAVKMAIDFIADRLAGEINEEQEELLNVSKRNVDRLAKLINEVLTFQKLMSGKANFDMKPKDVNEIARDVYGMMAHPAKEKKLDFSIKLEDSLPKVKLDSDQINQVLTNIVHNAIKFTEKGGIAITTSKNDHTIQISVSDTGCGIKKEDMPRLFKEFEQLERKKGSTGLGLSICKKIIEQHKGEIWAESEPGKGTSFHFVLPTKERVKTWRRES